MDAIQENADQQGENPFHQGDIDVYAVDDHGRCIERRDTDEETLRQIEADYRLIFCRKKS
jgi:hypothetical protein